MSLSPSTGRALQLLDSWWTIDGDLLLSRCQCMGQALLINGVSLLETELGNRQANHLMLVHFHAPPGQEIERRHGPRNPGAKVGPYPMADFLAMENRGEHREHRFYQHPGIPGPTRTDLHIGGIAGRGMETGICQDNHLAVKLGNQGLKMRVVDVGCGAVPGTDQAPLVQDETEFAADNPAMIPFAFLPNLGRAASFPHGVNQLDAIAVSDAQHRGRSQKARGPRGVGLEEPCQAGALGYLREQRYVIACQPAIEGPGPAAFDSMQQGQRDDFAGIQFGLRVFRDLQHLLVHRVEQCDNKILGSHTPGSARLKSVQPQLELSRDYLSTRTLAITYQTNTIGYYVEHPEEIEQYIREHAMAERDTADVPQVLQPSR